MAYLVLRRRLDVFAGSYQRVSAFAYNVGALLAFAVAVRLEFWAGILLTALCPMAYLTLGIAWGHGFIVALGLVPPVAELTRSGDLAGTVTGTLPWGLATIAFSILVATSIAFSDVRSCRPRSRWLCCAWRRSRWRTCASTPLLPPAERCGIA